MSQVGTVQELRSHLEEMATMTDREWMDSLSPRKVAELEFHDHDRDQQLAKQDPKTWQRNHANTKYYATAQLYQRHMHEWIARNARGRIFLDYACGGGMNTIRAAKAGATLAVGIDISRVSIENARRLAEAEGVGANTFFVQADCENTLLPDATFDAIICGGMLHHLDLSYAFPELRRILKPGGRILGVEAMNYNPVFRAYRLLTPHLRTDWEKRHILSHDDLRFAQRFFEVQDIRYWHLMSLLATPLRGTPLFGPVLQAGNALDRLLLRVPGLRLMAWIFTFELVRPVEDA